MAPRRGGGGGGGGSTSSSSCDSSSDYPCTTQLHYIYGSRVSSYYTQAELYGQLVLFIIWSIALIVLLIASLKSKARWLHAAMLSFLASFAFLCARYGLMIAESDVPIGYRFESSIVVLLQRLGMIFLFAGVFPPESSKLFKFIFWPILGTYAVLNITYLILDFIISSKGLNVFKDTWDWRLSDRDFGLTITPHGIVELTTNGDFNMSPFYVESRMYDSSSEDNFQHQRSVQIKIGVAADFLALALAVFILAVASITWIKNRRKLIRGSTWLLIAGFGLLLSTLFHVIVVTHYVLHNWDILSDFRRWIDWTLSFSFDDNGLNTGGGGGFLEGFRTTVQGFPIIQALFEPLGIVLACATMVMWWRGKRKSVERVEYTGQAPY